MDLVDVLLWMLVAFSLWPAFTDALAKGGVTRMVLVASSAIAVALVAYAANSEKAWERLAQEDGIVEWATVFAFLAAAAWNLLVARKAAEGRLAKLLVIGVALFCVFVAGEEISWGQRLFAFQPPEAFLANNFQQELNVHNVLMDERALGFKLESKHLVAIIAFGFGVLMPLARRVPQLAFLDAVTPTAALAPGFLAVVAGELTYPVELAGEGAEMLLGVLFLGMALVAAPPRRPAITAVAFAAPLVLGAITAPFLARVVFGSDEEGSRMTAEELEKLRADVERGLQDKVLKKKGTVHKRVFTASRDGYVKLSGGAFLDGKATPAEQTEGDLRRDRRGYFLDPWNNPYWILVEGKDKRVVVYSFGPNRQRDTAVRDRNKPTGDDVMAVFPLRAADGDVDAGEQDRAKEEGAPAPEETDAP